MVPFKGNVALGRHLQTRLSNSRRYTELNYPKQSQVTVNATIKE